MRDARETKGYLITTPEEEERAVKSLRELTEEYIEDVAKEICECYCKYPEQWDEEKEGMELIESDICANCPLNRL